MKELGAPVFAFGADWFSILQNPILGLEVVKRLGVGGVPYGSVKSRSVIVLRGSDGLTVIAAKHNGSTGPPNPEDTLRLRGAIDRCQ